MASVGSVLLIACLNVAVLLLAKGTVRRKELAIRLSIGSSRSRLIRQLLIESLTIACLSAILGLALAHWGTQLLLSYAPGLETLDVRPNARILAFTVATTIASALVFGLFPALRATKTDLNPALKDVKTPLSYSRPRIPLNKVLIATQIGLSLVLLVGSGLFVRTLRNLSNIDTGFDRGNVVVFELNR